jgi:hypothetical protein
MWKKEDDIGFLPGFIDSLTVGSLILESGLRYCAGNAAQGHSVTDLFDPVGIRLAIAREVETRQAAGRPAGDNQTLMALAAQIRNVGGAHAKGNAPASKSMRLMRSYLNACPINMQALGVVDIHGAAHAIQARLTDRQTGLFHRPIEQMLTAMRIARG